LPADRCFSTRGQPARRTQKSTHRDQFGAFSADGRRLAIYVQLRRPAQPGLAVIDVGRAEARPLPGSQAATPFGCQPCLGWSIDGWLFFFSGGPPPGGLAIVALLAKAGHCKPRQ
jgi:hypothetical protein